MGKTKISVTYCREIRCGTKPVALLPAFSFVFVAPNYQLLITNYHS